MTAEEIRAKIGEPTTFLREIAAQLAEQNEILRKALEALNSPFAGLFKR